MTRDFIIGIIIGIPVGMMIGSLARFIRDRGGK